MNDLEKGGHLSAFFYDLPFIHSFSDVWENDKDRWFYTARDTTTGNFLVMAAINNFVGYAGQCHFCFAHNTEQYAHILAKEWLNSVVSENALKALYGLTPKPYRHAVNFAKSVGFEVIGELPKSCYMAKHNKYVDGIITVYKRKE